MFWLRRESGPRQNYSLGIGSAELLSGKWFGEITLREVLRKNYLRERVRGNHSRGGGSAELLSGRWFGKITLRRVVRPRKDTREGVPAVIMRQDRAEVSTQRSISALQTRSRKASAPWKAHSAPGKHPFCTAALATPVKPGHRRAPSAPRESNSAPINWST